MQGTIRSIIAAAGFALSCYVQASASLPPEPIKSSTAPPAAEPAYREFLAYVTGYNTVQEQTDSTPCIGAMGSNICGRRDVVACPRTIKFGTVVEINGRSYLCEDRLAQKFAARFDINCNKDKTCTRQVAGWAYVKVFDE